MDPPPYPGYVVTQQVGQPVVMSYPTQQIITQPVMPAVQTVGYIQAPPVQHQIVQHQVITVPPVQTQPAVVIASQPVVARNYAATAPGIFKIIEFFSLLIAWACAARYKEIFSFFEPNGRLKFFLAVFILAWLLVMLFFFIYVASCHKQCGGAVATVFGAVIYGVFTLLLFIASCLLADDASNWQPTRKYLSPHDKEYVNNLYAAVAFGFLSAFLFLTDAILFCSHDANRVTPPPAPVVVQPQPFLRPQATVIHVPHD